MNLTKNKAKIKVCLIITDLIAHGAQRATLNLAQELAANGYEVHVIYASPQQDLSIKHPNIFLHSLNYSPWKPVAAIIKPLLHFKRGYKWFYSNRVKKLQDKIQEFGPFAAIFSNLPEMNFLAIAAGLPNLYCIMHRDIKSEEGLIWTQSILPNKLMAKIKIVRAKHFYAGQNIISVSEEIKTNALALGIKPRSIECIYNVFDFAAIREEARAYEVAEQDYIVHVGRLTVDKDPILVLRAYVASGIKQQLMFVGSGGLEEKIVREAQRLGIQDKLIMKGLVSNPYPYIKQAKALVLGSKMEGLPTVLIEALILGTPAVSTDCPTGPQEILTEELAQFLSPIGDTASLAANLRRVISAPPQILPRHIAKFDKHTTLPKYLDLINVL